jgi:hypothetical protein
MRNRTQRGRNCEFVLGGAVPLACAGRRSLDRLGSAASIQPVEDYGDFEEA